MKMKIAIKATHITEGGGLTHLNQMIKWFGKLAPHSNFVLIGKSGQENMFVPAPANFEYQYHRLPSFNLASRLLWERFVLGNILKKLCPDLLFEPGNTGMLNAPCPRVSLIHNIAPFDTEYVKEESFYQRLRQRTLRKETLKNMKAADGIIMLSNYCQEYFSDYIDGARTKTAVIYHGGAENIGRHNGKSILADLGVPDEYILSVSHIWRYKKLEELVEGYLLALNKNPELPCFVQAGTVYDQKYMNGILEMVRKSRHVGKIKFLGNVEPRRLQALYQNCRAFVFSSMLETCSVILIEALGHGCAMACSDRGVVPEVCGDAAIYFDPYNPEDIAQKIFRLCEDKALNAALCEKSKSRAKNFGWEKSAAETLNFFDLVLNGDSHARKILSKRESSTNGLFEAVNSI